MVGTCGTFRSKFSSSKKANLLLISTFTLPDLIPTSIGVRLPSVPKPFSIANDDFLTLSNAQRSAPFTTLPLTQYENTNPPLPEPTPNLHHTVAKLCVGPLGPDAAVIIDESRFIAVPRGIDRQVQLTVEAQIVVRVRIRRGAIVHGAEVEEDE